MDTTFWSGLSGHDLTLPVQLSEQLTKFQLSDGVRTLLAHAARINTLKKSDRDILSTTIVVAAAIDLVRKAAKLDTPRDNDDRRDLDAMAALDRLASTRRTNFDSLIQGLLRERWYPGIALPLSTAPDGQNPSLSVAVYAAIEDASKQINVVPVDRLMVGALQRSTELRGRFGRIDLDIDQVITVLEELKLRYELPPSESADDNLTSTKIDPDIISDTPPSSEGTRADGESGLSGTFGVLPPSMSRRTRSTADTLNTRYYAASVATLLRREREELCVGIFGHWGIGKTHLAEEITKLLTTDQEDLRKILRDDAGIPADEISGAEFDQKYDTVTFSAWKYPRTREYPNFCV